MSKIALLSQETIDKIAAGEVVERPSSVVKELVENAIDAGASAITVEIKEGGISLIRITDNGCGIPKEEVPLAFLRHSTSKIRSAEDLMCVHSLGFRGEALSSIAAVSRVEMITKPADALTGTRYVIEGSKEIADEEIGAPDGTTFLVRDLFYNTPARMKFLKKDVSEGTFVADIVLHEALSHPEIAFRFLRDGKQQFMTPGDGQLRSAAYAVLGREFARDLLPLDGDGGVYKVTGLVTPPGGGGGGGVCYGVRGLSPPAARLPGVSQCAAFLRQWPLCQKPHHDGCAGKRLQGYPDAGQIPRRHPAR
mgnify:CR=1 FL=1